MTLRETLIITAITVCFSLACSWVSVKLIKFISVIF